MGERPRRGGRFLAAVESGRRPRLVTEAERQTIRTIILSFTGREQTAAVRAERAVKVERIPVAWFALVDDEDPVIVDEIGVQQPHGQIVRVHGSCTPEGAGWAFPAAVSR